jgi:hypothetical protein
MPTAPSAPALVSAKPKGKGGLLVAVILGILALGVVGYVGYTKFMAEKPDTVTASLPSRSSKSKKVAAATGATNTEPQGGEESKPAAAKGPKATGDLKSGDVILEQSKGGSSLVYAVGTIANNSDHQRFGVKVEVDILDKAGKKIGKATDYIQVIEPRDKWRFHALVLEDKAASAKIASIKEEE